MDAVPHSCSLIPSKGPSQEGNICSQIFFLPVMNNKNNYYIHSNKHSGKSGTIRELNQALGVSK